MQKTIQSCVPLLERLNYCSLFLDLQVIYRVSQKKRGAFVGLWRRIESFDHRKLIFAKQLSV